MRRERRLEALGRGRLGQEAERAAREAVLPVLVERDDLHRDVAQRRVLLELAEHRPAEHVGQEDVERDRRRAVLARERQRLGAARRDQHLEALRARQVDEDARVVRIVLDDEQHRVARRRCSSRSSGTVSIGRSRTPRAAGTTGAAAPRGRARRRRRWPTARRRSAAGRA